jgi:hypothetical protein
MGITEKQLKSVIHRAGFPIELREQIFDLVWTGLERFREYKVPGYYGYRTSIKANKSSGHVLPKAEPIKKPKPEHHAPIGRYDQTGARTILVSALCRAWMIGFDKSPTLNHKHDPDSEFALFATDVMAFEGIGKIHEHLEEYWSIRKNS